MPNMRYIRSVWWRDAHVGMSDPRAKHALEELKPYAALRISFGLLILFVGLPALALPSRLGVIPYVFPHEFLESSGVLRYLICLLGSWLTFLPVKPPWDLPVPKVIGASWQVGVAVAFIVMVVVGVKLVKDGWALARDNRGILQRRNARI